MFPPLYGFASAAKQSGGFSAVVRMRQHPFVFSFLRSKGFRALKRETASHSLQRQPSARRSEPRSGEES